MALSTLVKISGVNNLSDARFCAGMGATILGFCPEESHPDFIDHKKFRDITGWIKGVKLAGEFYSSGLDQIRELDNRYQFDYLQTGNLQFMSELSKWEKPLIFYFDLNSISNISDVPDILETLKDKVIYFIIDGHGIEGEWTQKVHQWSDRYPILFGADVNKANVLTVVNQYNYQGLSLHGGFEIKPGYYDFGELAEILELLEAGN